jgi:hypothetical protein
VGYFISRCRWTLTELERQIKGVLPTDKDLASADALLKRAIDTDTFATPPIDRGLWVCAAWLAPS